MKLFVNSINKLIDEYRKENNIPYNGKVIFQEKNYSTTVFKAIKTYQLTLWFVNEEKIKLSEVYFTENTSRASELEKTRNAMYEELMKSFMAWLASDCNNLEMLAKGNVNIL